MKKIAVLCLSLVLAAPIVLAQSTSKQRSSNKKPITRLEQSKEIQRLEELQQRKIKTHFVSHGEEIMLLARKQNPRATTVATDSISGNLERAIYQRKTKGDIYHDNVFAEPATPSRQAAREEDEEVIFLTEDDVYHKDVTRGKHLTVNTNIELEESQEGFQSPDDFHRDVYSQGVIAPGETNNAKQGASRSKSRFAHSSDAAYQAVSLAEMLQDAGVEATEDEILAAQETLAALVHLKYYVASQKQENPLLILQSFVYFYEQIAYSFAANKDIDARFEAKNPALVKELAKVIQQPMKVGWEKDKTIVMGSYIAEHLPEAYATWGSSEVADELDTFNRDILVNAAK